MNSCKYWDCGWCYAPADVETNARIVSKVCHDPNNCPYLKSQMTKEIDISTVLIEGDTATIMGVKYKRVDEPKTPAEEAYKEVYGWYPPTTSSVSNYEDNRWSAFQNGYTSAKEKNVVEEPEELKTLYQMMYDEKWCTSGCDEFCKIVKRWMSQYEINKWDDDWDVGFSDCLDKLNKGLK